MIPKKHLVRTLNEDVDELDLEPLFQQYKGGGIMSCHTRMMLKVLVYAHTENFFIPANSESAARKHQLHLVKRLQQTELQDDQPVQGNGDA